MDAPQLPGSGAGGAEPATDVRTFLLVDVRGYTRFTLEQGDEAAARLAAQFAALVRDVVAARGGELLELRGDEALVVFTSARRALRAAAELQERFTDALLRDPAQWRPVGMGLDAGEAIPVEGGYRGGALNLAGRLVSLAGPGEVLASEAVVHLAGKLAGLTYVERGLVQLKGFTDLVRVIRIEYQLAATQAPEQPSPESVSPPPGAGVATYTEPELPIGGFLGALPDGELIGREGEIARILDALDAVMSGHGRLLMLAGEPGVGKTRLAQEVTRVARNRGALVATGRCYESHRAVPYYPFLEALATLWAAAPAVIRADAPRHWPLLGRLLPERNIAPTPATSSGHDEQEYLFRAVTGFIQAIAAVTPVALLLDDLQWADSASLDLLQHLARHTRAGRVLLLGAYRDIEVGREHRLERIALDLHREKLIEEIAVRRLRPAGTAALTASLFGEATITPEFADLLYRYTEGNAFFLQEVLRALVERGDLFEKDGKWERRAIAEIELPHSVRSAIGERLSRLTSAAQDVLLEASVLGQTFPFDVLQAMSGRSEEEIEDALAAAVAAGLAREAPNDEYRFNHALIQQTLYAEAPTRRKRRLHRAAGEALERYTRHGRAPLAAEIAWHFLEGDDAERALRYSILAGKQAETNFALTEVEKHYGAALDLARQLGDRVSEAEVLRRRARLLHAAFRGEEAARDYEDLLAIALASEDRQQELEARLGLGGAYYVFALDHTDSDYPARSRQQCAAAYELARQLGDRRGMARARLAAHWLTDFFPEDTQAIDAGLREAAALSEETGDEELILNANVALHGALKRAEAEPRVDELLRQLEARRDLFLLNRFYFRLMWTYLWWGDFRRCVECCDAGIKLAPEIGVPPVQYPTLKAFALLDLGRWSEAWASLQREIADDEHPFGHAMRDLGCGAYWLELRDYRRAIETLRGVIEQASRLRRVWMRQRAQAWLVRALLGAGRMEEASQILLDGATDRIDNGYVNYGKSRAELLLAQGALDEALLAVEALVSAVARDGYDPDHVYALDLQTRILLQAGQPMDALVVADRALALAQRIDYRSLVWRVQARRAEALDALGEQVAAALARQAAAGVITELADSVSDLNQRRHFLADAEVAAVPRAGAATPRRGRAKEKEGKP
jgi:class 3 adenylate cyclase